MIVRRVVATLGRRRLITAAAILTLVVLASLVSVGLVAIVDTDGQSVQQPPTSVQQPPTSARQPPTSAQGTAAWPTEPPARICDNQQILGAGPVEPPGGAVIVPAGNNEAMGFALREQNTVFWFEPGVHTLGEDEFSQIVPGSGSTYVGAPGAVIDGRHLNRYAFTGEAVNVTIRYLTVRNFVAPMNEGVVNHNDGAGWLVEYSTITRNKGAGLMAGAPNNTYRYNCISENGQYGVNACCGTEGQPVHNLVLDHNEITGNNTDDWENVEEGCGCTGGAKFWINNDGTVTNNWLHDNRGVGLWLDNNNTGFVIEGNYVENNDSHAIVLEAGYDARIQHNNFKRNALVTGREYQRRSDPFPIAAIYIADNGSPDGYGLKNTPSTISNNNFEDNWGGVAMWESADRYCSSTAHTHPPFCTIKVDLYDDSQCRSDVEDVIPDSIGDKYRCRWSTENNLVEDNVFTIDKAAVGEGCEGGDYCGVNGLFGGYGVHPEFSGYEIMWRVTFRQGNVFRNNRYIGDWKFAGFQPDKPNGGRVTWAEWTAPAPAVPDTFTHDNRPQTFGQDQGSRYNE